MRYSATIGFFDGVHKGHQYVIEQLKRDAAEYGLQAAVVTFRQHPRQVLQQDYIPKLITTAEQKEQLLKKCGVRVIMLDFTTDLAQLTAKEFMKLLRDEYQVTRLLVGYDHRFGHNRVEGPEDYKRYAEELSMQVKINDLYSENSVNVSSSIIRKLLAEGRDEEAQKLLGWD